MTHAIDIRPHDLEIVRSILHSILPPVTKVWVFGSRARLTARAGSDLDLAIDAGRPLTCEESSQLSFAFEDSDLPYTVDIVDWQTASESFRSAISASLLLLRKDGNARCST